MLGTLWTFGELHFWTVRPEHRACHAARRAGAGAERCAAAARGAATICLLRSILPSFHLHFLIMSHPSPSSFPHLSLCLSTYLIYLSDLFIYMSDVFDLLIKK